MNLQDPDDPFRGFDIEMLRMDVLGIDGLPAAFAQAG
jgi:hypothetical protein